MKRINTSFNQVKPENICLEKKKEWIYIKQLTSMGIDPPPASGSSMMSPGLISAKRSKLWQTVERSVVGPKNEMLRR